MEMNVDVLIVGTGAAGLYTALNLKSNLNILLISKAKMKESNSYLAQGGISTARNEEDIPTYIEDTLKAGKYKNDVEAVKVLVGESIENINRLEEIGVQLDKENNELLYTKEAAHSINRIVHAKDATGKAVIDSLTAEVVKRKNVRVYEDTYMVDVLKQGNKCCGAIAIRNGQQLNIHSKVVVLATGGIGGIFKNSTNQRHLTGDGIYVALKNKVKLKNLEYIQMHPTAFHEEDGDKRKFLISESVRGEGGKLVNREGHRFVNELLPRDVVSDAIFEEMKKTGTPHVYLDITFFRNEYTKKRFPTIYEECSKRGIDITKELIPISPVQHYFMGGIEVDLESKTSMENLFAVGEVSCTGVHGANRLASNSLLECLVFSKRAADYINESIEETELIVVKPKVLQQDIKTIKKANLDVVVTEFKRKVGKLGNELVNN